MAGGVGIKTIATFAPFDGEPVGLVSVGTFVTTRPNGDRVELGFMDTEGELIEYRPDPKDSVMVPAVRWLSPAQARSLARLLLEAADECGGGAVVVSREGYGR
jgi:hypothetical protein